MPSRRPHNPPVRAAWAYSPRLHAVLYSFLLVATPFLLLRNYLVNFIGASSVARTTVFGIEITVVPVAACVLVAAAAIVFRRHITVIRVLAGLVVIAMIALAQQITDFYFGHHFYDLQQNWHYLAYGLFAFMLWRDLSPRGLSASAIMLITFGAALAFSTFDELFQMFVSSRVFDISDIAKDTWGTLAGVTVLYLGNNTWRGLRHDWSRLHYARVRDYFQHPATAWLFLAVFGLVFLMVSSLLTEPELWPVLVILTLAATAIVTILYYLTQKKWPRRIIVGLLVLVLAAQVVSFVHYRGTGIQHAGYGLTVYNGIVIPFFDVMVYPDRAFRLVDKKHYFNFRDQDFFLKQKPDILLVATGFEGRGGQGFPREKTHFVYNDFLGRGTQLILLKTPDACRLYNRLISEGKRVLLILHSTC